MTDNISIHALLAESDGRAAGNGSTRYISIHALLAESDQAQDLKIPAHGNFYPRSPCGERLSSFQRAVNVERFLSTLSLRRATINKQGITTRRDISIHALLAESDDNLTQGVFNLFAFLSTLSLRRATCTTNSITIWTVYFYPRSPCGERLISGNTLHELNNFYPRSPCGERQQKCTKQ